MPNFTSHYNAGRKVISVSGKRLKLQEKIKIPPYTKAETKVIAAFSLAAGKTGMWIYLFLKQQFDMNSKRYGEEHYYPITNDYIEAKANATRQTKYAALKKLKKLNLIDYKDKTKCEGGNLLARLILIDHDKK